MPVEDQLTGALLMAKKYGDHQMHERSEGSTSRRKEKKKKHHKELAEPKLYREDRSVHQRKNRKKKFVPRPPFIVASSSVGTLSNYLRRSLQ